MAELLRFAVDAHVALEKLGSTSPADVVRTDAALEKWLWDVCEDFLNVRPRPLRPAPPRLCASRVHPSRPPTVLKF